MHSMTYTSSNRALASRVALKECEPKAPTEVSHGCNGRRRRLLVFSLALVLNSVPCNGIWSTSSPLLAFSAACSRSSSVRLWALLAGRSSLPPAALGGSLLFQRVGARADKCSTQCVAGEGGEAPQGLGSRITWAFSAIVRRLRPKSVHVATGPQISSDARSRDVESVVKNGTVLAVPIEEASAKTRDSEVQTDETSVDADLDVKVSDISLERILNAFNLDAPPVFGFPDKIGVPMIIAALATGAVMGASLVLASSSMWGEYTALRTQQKELAQTFEQRLQDRVTAARQEELVVLEQNVERDSLELIREVGLQDQLIKFSKGLQSLTNRVAELKTQVMKENDEMIEQADKEQQAGGERPPTPAASRDDINEEDTITLLERMLAPLQEFVDEQVTDLDNKQEQLSDLLLDSSARMKALATDWELPQVIPQQEPSPSPEPDTNKPLLEKFLDLRLPRGVVEYVTGVVSGSTGALVIALLAVLSVPLVRRRQKSRQQRERKGFWRWAWGSVSGSVKGGFQVLKSRFAPEPELQESAEVASTLGASQRVSLPPVDAAAEAATPKLSSNEMVQFMPDPRRAELEEFGEVLPRGYDDPDTVELIQQLPPLAVGDEAISTDKLLQAGTALRVYSRWEGAESVEEWIPLLAVAIEGPVQAAFVRALWAARDLPGVEHVLTNIVSKSVCARVQKRGWKELVIGAQTSSRTLNFGYELLTSSTKPMHDVHISKRDIVHIPGSYIR